MRILIVKTSSLGDIIHAFPVVEYLKQCQPGCLIDWVVEEPFAQLVRSHPLLNQMIPISTKRWRTQLLYGSTWREAFLFCKMLRKTSYDLVLDLQGNTKSGLVTALAKGKKKVGFDYASVPEWPNLLATRQRYFPPPGKNIKEDYLFLAHKAMGKTMTPKLDSGVRLLLSPHEKKQLEPLLDQLSELKTLKVLVCPGSNWSNKQLSRESLEDFLQRVSNDLAPHFLFVWGTLGEKQLCEEIALTLPGRCTMVERLTLPGLQNLMAHADLVVAMDSLALHLADIASVPTYSIFGASSADKYKPIGEQHAAFQGSCPYGKSFEKRCELLRSCKTGACIKQIQGAELFAHFSQWWSDRKQQF